MARRRRRDSSPTLKGKKQGYQEAVGRIRPKPHYVSNMLKAFLVGGLICLVGQVILTAFSSVERTQDEIIATTQAGMIFLGALLTDIGVYDNLGQFSGMGAAVPITGFANTIVSAAIDFRREGWITGMASKMFIIAGPVLVYGILSGFSVGLIKLVFTSLVR